MDKKISETFPTINIDINQFDILAPIIAASLLNAAYQKLALSGVQNPTEEMLSQTLSDVLLEWSALTVKISEFARDAAKHTQQKP